MKFLIIVCLSSAISNFTFCQKISNRLKVTPFVKLDHYPEFSYVVNARPSTDFVNINGTSFGLNLAYQIPISNSVSLNSGIGYYRYSFTDIKNVNSSFGISDARYIKYNSGAVGADISYYTDRYWYNTISANIGVEKKFDLKKQIEISVGCNLNNYFTVTQYYHLAYNSIGSRAYHKYNIRYFGYSFNLEGNLLKKFGEITLGPSFIFPVLDTWKADNSFPKESNSTLKSKYLGGIGLGISCYYLFHSKK